MQAINELQTAATALGEGFLSSIETLDSVSRMVAAKASALVRSIEALPTTAQELEALLVELADAKAAMDQNFQIWPRTVNPKVYDESKECREHWGKALDRRDAAAIKLAQLGEALLRAREVAA